jgi:hypothetical protein
MLQMTNVPLQYNFTFEKDPDTDDLMLILPEDFLTTEGWRAGDTLKLTAKNRDELVISNKSKQERGQD